MKLLVQALAAGAIALMVLYPRTTQAEDVEDYDRVGEWDDDGQRFGSIVIHASLEPSPTAPGGWTLVRTFENKSDEIAEATVEEHLQSTESLEGARVTPAPVTVLARTQKLKLGPHEKKSIGVFLPATIGPKITKGEQRHALGRALMAAGKSDNDMTYEEFSVTYLRPLAKGETVAKHEGEYRVDHPARMPSPLRGPNADMQDDGDEIMGMGSNDTDPPTPANAKLAKLAPASQGKL